MLDDIARLRRFNRAVTREVGALETSYLGRGRPLGAARVLQLVRAEGTDIAEIRQRLDLDSGLLSRLLRSLEAESLLVVETDPADRRRRIAKATPAGLAEQQAYEKLGFEKATQMLARAGARQGAVIAAMDLIATVMLQDHVDLRDADPDDPAAIACLTAYYQLLAEKIAGVTPDMLTLPLPDAAKYRPPQGAFLIAWSDDLPVGCVSLRPLEPGVAEVKRLWIDPIARGQGLGRRLMRALETRARDMGFIRLKLDTNAALPEALGLYQATGWTQTTPYTSFPATHWFQKAL